VTRISPSGGFGFWDQELVLNLADRYGPATHVDPCCVFCSNATALIISRLLSIRNDLLAEFDIDAMMRDLLDSGSGIDKHQEMIMKYIIAETIEELELSGNQAIRVWGSALQCTRMSWPKRL
jgi:ADP-ribosylglycohydrolase